MKRILVLSIKPKYVEKILSGEKCIECRKTRIKRGVVSAIIYATAPIKKVVAIAEVVCITSCRKELLWESGKEILGISRREFDEYYKGHEGNATAVVFGDITKFECPLEWFGLKRPPQSFCYLEEQQTYKL